MKIQASRSTVKVKKKLLDYGRFYEVPRTTAPPRNNGTLYKGMYCSYTLMKTETR